MTKQDKARLREIDSGIKKIHAISEEYLNWCKKIEKTENQRGRFLKFDKMIKQGQKLSNEKKAINEKG